MNWSKLIAPTITLLCGVQITMIAFRWINPSKGTADQEKVEEWHRRFGPIVRIVGPVLVVIALANYVYVFGDF